MTDETPRSRSALSRLTILGSALFVIGSVIGMVQAWQSGDALGVVASLMFAAGSLAFLGVGFISD